jgi:hypothetical protein
MQNMPLFALVFGTLRPDKGGQNIAHQTQSATVTRKKVAGMEVVSLR